MCGVDCEAEQVRMMSSYGSECSNTLEPFLAK